MTGRDTPPGASPPEGERFDAAYYEDVYRTGGLRRRLVDRYYARLAGRLLRRTGGRKILDVGCGQGHLLAALAPLGEVWGTEVSAHAVERSAAAAPGARVVLGNIDAEIPAGLGKGSFDVVIARYLFEHLNDPGGAIERCAALLRPGGFLFFSVPNTESLGARWKGKDWFGHGDDTHVSLLAPDEWKRHLARAGLEIDRIFSDGLWDVPYVKGVPRVVQLAVFSLPAIASVLFVSTALPLRWGENLIAFARKPPAEG